MESLTVNVYITEKARRAGVREPKRAHPTDSGYDVESPIACIIWPFTCKKIWTGLVFDIPTENFNLGGIPCGIDMTVTSRTSRALKLIEPGPRTVDRTYRPKEGDQNGMVIGMKNTSLLPYMVKKHERLAQLIFRPFVDVALVSVKSEREIYRGTGKNWRGEERFGDSDEKEQET